MVGIMSLYPLSPCFHRTHDVFQLIIKTSEYDHKVIFRDPHHFLKLSKISTDGPERLLIRTRHCHEVYGAQISRVGG